MAVVTNGATYWLENEVEGEGEFRYSGGGWPDLLSRATAIIHTHPCGMPYPSVLDQVQQAAMDVPWLIVPRGSEPFAFGTKERPPLIGRSFRWAVADCLTLAADYYLERGRATPRVAREWGFWKAGVDLFGDHVERAGFRLKGTALELAVDGDLLLFRIRSDVYNHCGVVSDGALLHHPGSFAPYDPGCLSRLDSLYRWAVCPLAVYEPC